MDIFKIHIRYICQILVSAKTRKQTRAGAGNARRCRKFLKEVRERATRIRGRRAQPVPRPGGWHVPDKCQEL